MERTIKRGDIFYADLNPIGQVYADGEGAVELWQDAFGEPADVVLQSTLVYGADLLKK